VDEAISNGNFVFGNINHIKSRLLLDTGASKSCISLSFLKRLKLEAKPLNTGDIRRLFTANQTSIEIVGTIDLDVRIQGLLIPFTFNVLNKLAYNAILGIDFLTQTKTKIDLENNVVTFYDIVTSPLEPKTKLNYLRTNLSVIVQPKSEILLPVSINKSYKLKTSMIEPINSFKLKSDLLVARTVIDPQRHSTNCRLLNMTSKKQYVKKGTIIASLCSAQVCSESKLTQKPVSPDNTTLDHKIEVLENLGIPKINNPDLSEDDKTQFIELLYNNRDLFAEKFEDIPGTNVDIKHEIKLTDYTPVRQRPYRHSPRDNEIIEKQVKGMLAGGIIERSRSQYASPCLLVAKGGSSEKRLVIDYRKINELTVPVHFPLPTLPEILDKLADKQPVIFSNFDLRHAYYQSCMAEDSKQYTAFITSSGVYQFNRCAQGLRNSPSFFGHLIYHITVSHQHYLQSYLDDLILYSSSVQNHIEHIQAVLNTFRETNLRLHPKKCFWAQNSVTFLGHCISKDGIRLDRRKTKILENFPPPKNQKQLKSFLGLSSWMRTFINSYSKRTFRLRELLKKDSTWQWDKAHESQFNDIRTALISDPVLMLPRLNDEFHLFTDASTQGIGYILSQTDPSTGRLRPIAYGGRGLRSNEANFCISELELLSIITAFREYNCYFAQNKVNIHTDHCALSYIKNLKHGNNARLLRWSLFLSTFNYTIKYRPGKAMQGPDCLSRLEFEDNTEPADEDELLMCLHDDVFQHLGEKPKRKRKEVERITFIYDKDVTQNDQPILQSNTDTEINNISDLNTLSTECFGGNINISKQQDQCVDYGPIKRFLVTGELPTNEKLARKIILDSDNYTINEDNVLEHLYTPRTKNLDRLSSVIKQICIPDSLRMELVESTHISLIHPGVDKLYGTLRMKYYFPNMWKLTEEYTKTCAQCLRVKSHKSHGHLKPIASTERMTEWLSDHLGPLPMSGGNKYVLSFIDRATLWVELFAVPSTDALTVAKIFYQEICCRYGRVKAFCTDRGSAYKSKLIAALCKYMGVKKTFSSSLHPQSQGRVEYFNHTILKSLKLLATKQDQWSEFLPEICWAYRSTSLTNLGISPFECVFLTKPQLNFDLAIGGEQKMLPDIRAHIEELKSRLKITEQLIKDNQTDCNKVTKQYYDKTAKSISFAVGEHCLVHNPSVVTGESRKIKVPWTEHIVTEKVSDLLYRLKDPLTGRELKSLIHVDRMHKFDTARDALYQQFPALTDGVDDDDDRVDSRPVSDVLSRTPTIVDTTADLTQAADDSRGQVDTNRQTAVKPVKQLQQTVNKSKINTSNLPEGYYLIDKVLKQKKEKGIQYFLVRWTDGTCSYEPKSHLTQAALDSYYIELSQKNAKRRRNKNRWN
jgi:hypothetical protein